MASFASKRLTKELAKIHDHLPPGITLVSADNLQIWELDIQVLDPAATLYTNQIFRLRFRFSEKYPIEAPEVVFLPLTTPQTPRPIPLHPHIYSNGIICLDLLGTGWSPVQNVESIAMSLQSMLTGNRKAERPQGDEEFCRRMGPGTRPRDLGFVYEDDTV